MKFKWFTPTSWLWVLAGFLLAGLIHVGSILALPHVTEGSAWQRIGLVVPEHDMKLLPVISPDYSPLPFMSPDIRYAGCRYDISDGTVTVKARLLHPSWSVALFKRDGTNFYTVSGADLQRGALELVIIAAPLNTPRPTGVGSDAVVVNSPDEIGLVLMLAPQLGEAYALQTSASVSQATCTYRANKE